MNHKCDTCGNDYAESFQITLKGQSYVFDSFECAIHKLAPLCRHCGCRIIGHGEEREGYIYCCSHCMRHATEAQDAPSGSGS